MDAAIGSKDNKPYPIEWRYLRKLLWHFLYTDQLVVFKVRQIMATWSLAVLYLWEAMAVAGTQSMFVSKGKLESKAFLKRVYYIYARLPVDWKKAVPMENPLTEKLEWKNGSVIRAMASVAVSGRSFTLSRAVADEAGHIKHCVDLKDNLQSCCGERGKSAFVSTPYEVESDFEQLVMDAEEGKGELLKFPLDLVAKDRGAHYRAVIDQKLQKMSQKGRDTEYGLKFAIKEENALFPNFDPKIHVIGQEELENRYGTPGEPFRINAESGRNEACPVYCAIDPHNTKPTAVLWMVVLPDETWYVIDELWDRGHIEKTIKKCLLREAKWRVISRVVDPFANRQNRTLGVPTLAAKMRKLGMAGLRTARRERIGIDNIQAKMEVGRNGLPGYLISPKCKNLIRQMRTAGHKDDMAVQKGGQYHFVDCAKYIANSRPVYNVKEWQEANLEPDERYAKLLKEFNENVRAAQQGVGRQWTKTMLT